MRLQVQRARSNRCAGDSPTAPSDPRGACRKFALLAVFIVLTACGAPPESATVAVSAPTALAIDPPTSPPAEAATSPPPEASPPATEPPPPPSEPPTTPAPTATIPYADAVRAALEGSGLDAAMSDCYVYLALADHDGGIALSPERSAELVNACRELTTPTTAAPPPPLPPVAVADLPDGCDPNYTGCVPVDSDVDCRGGSGNGPSYTGPVEVIGTDIYDLDRDNDGHACE